MSGTHVTLAILWAIILGAGCSQNKRTGDARRTPSPEAPATPPAVGADDQAAVDGTGSETASGSRDNAAYFRTLSAVSARSAATSDGTSSESTQADTEDEGQTVSTDVDAEAERDRLAALGLTADVAKACAAALDAAMQRGVDVAKLSEDSEVAASCPTVEKPAGNEAQLASIRRRIAACLPPLSREDLAVLEGQRGKIEAAFAAGDLEGAAAILSTLPKPALQPACAPDTLPPPAIPATLPRPGLADVATATAETASAATASGQATSTDGAGLSLLATDRTIAVVYQHENFSYTNRYFDTNAVGLSGYRHGIPAFYVFAAREDIAGCNPVPLWVTYFIPTGQIAMSAVPSEWPGVIAPAWIVGHMCGSPVEGTAPLWRLSYPLSNGTWQFTVTADWNWAMLLTHQGWYLQGAIGYVPMRTSF